VTRIFYRIRYYVCKILIPFVEKFYDIKDRINMVINFSHHNNILTNKYNNLVQKRNSKLNMSKSIKPEYYFYDATGHLTSEPHTSLPKNFLDKVHKTDLYIKSPHKMDRLGNDFIDNCCNNIEPKWINKFDELEI